MLGARVVAGGVALAVLGCDDSEAAKAQPTELVLPAGMTDLDAMRAVGKKYLEAHADLTLAKLMTDLNPERGFAVLDTEIRKQYSSGEVVRVAGWVLALTEVRIYAVVALRPTASAP